jgi:hypothetical protein
MEDKKLIDLYKEWVETGKLKDRDDSLGNGGLCNALPKKYRDTLELFVPMNTDTYDGGLFWAADSFRSRVYKFGKIRQTIVLFICAIRNEI